MWGIHVEEPHGEALAKGDGVLVYLGAPVWHFVARAEVASAVRTWSPSEAQRLPGDSLGGVLLSRVEEWDPPVPMGAVLSKVDPTEKARADFDTGVVRITTHEYDTAVAVAGRSVSWD